LKISYPLAANCDKYIILIC